MTHLSPFSHNHISTVRRCRTDRTIAFSDYDLCCHCKVDHEEQGPLKNYGLSNTHNIDNLWATLTEFAPAEIDSKGRDYIVYVDIVGEMGAREGRKSQSERGGQRNRSTVAAP